MTGIWIAALAAAAGAGTLALAAAVAAWVALSRERRLARLAGEFDELLRASESAAESRRLLVEHAVRLVPGAGAGFLLSGPGGDRLIPTLDVGADRTPLRSIRPERLPARACLAIRLQRPHRRPAGDATPARCDVCGAVEGEVVCQPVSAGGETVGALVVASDRPILARRRAALADSVRRVAPVLAGLPDPSGTDEHALSDPLTSLPNRRAAEQTLRRMAAHAGRAVSPLAAVMVELDHFRAVIEIQGRERADRVLATAAALIAGAVRGSDFVARWSETRFLLLLPDTGRTGAAELAEKIRRQIEATELVKLHPVTTSLGVACLPEDALDGEQLRLGAERAVEFAVTLGGNRVHAIRRAPARPPEL